MPGTLFSSMATIQVMESAANTLTFKKLETGIDLMEQTAWLITRLEWFLSNLDAATFNGDRDSLSLGLCASNAVPDITDLSNPAVIDFMQVIRLDIGAAATGVFEVKPYVREFTNVSGGGLLVPPNPLYAAAKGNGLTSATTNLVRIYYTQITLKADEYFNLWQSRRIISS